MCADLPSDLVLYDVHSFECIQRVHVEGGPKAFTTMPDGSHVVLIEHDTGLVYSFALQAPPAAAPGSLMSLVLMSRRAA